MSTKREHTAHLEGLLLRLGVGGVRGDEEVELLAERLRTERYVVDKGGDIVVSNHVRTARC